MPVEQKMPYPQAIQEITTALRSTYPKEVFDRDEFNRELRFLTEELAFRATGATLGRLFDNLELVRVAVANAIVIQDTVVEQETELHPGLIPGTDAV